MKKFEDILVTEIMKHLDKKYYRISRTDDTFVLANKPNSLYFKVQIWINTPITLCILKLDGSRIYLYDAEFIPKGSRLMNDSDHTWEMSDPSWEPKVIVDLIKQMGEPRILKPSKISLADKFKGIV